MKFGININRTVTKATMLFLMLAIFSGITGVMTTGAMFSDMEKSDANFHKASSLDLEFTSATISAEPISAGESVEFEVVATNSGQLTFDYNQQYAPEDPEDALCTQLHLTVTDELASPVYDGALVDFIATASASLVSGESDTYTYDVGIPEDTEDIYVEMSCSFDVTSYAWQPEIGQPEIGFWDVEEIPVTVNSGVWVSCREGGTTWATEVVSAVPDNGGSDNSLYEQDDLAYSLTNGGVLTLMFKHPVANGAGYDISIYEETDDHETDPEERAQVEVSHDGTTWYVLGDASNRDNGTGVSSFDFSGTGLPWIQYVRLTDTGLDNDYDVDAVSGHYSICDDPEAIACTDVQGKKTKAGTDEGLEDWEIVVHPTSQEPDQVLTINANDLDGEETMNLASDSAYLIEVTGTWKDNKDDGDGVQVDADYFSTDNWTGRNDHDEESSRDPRQRDLVIDDTDIDWGSYNDAHLYKYVMYGEDSSVRIRIFDEDEDESAPSWYEDNDGSLTVRIYDVTEQIAATDDNGDYSKYVCGTYYQIIEVNQPGWVQETPINPSYYHIDLRQLLVDERFNFANRRGGRLVINEVYYDVDGAHGTENKNEWIELYNNSPEPVNLKNWILVDEAGNEKIIHANVTLPGYSFAVLSHDHKTWTQYWTIPDDAITIQLTGSQAWLNNDGDDLILKDPDGTEVDAVSWGAGYTYAFDPPVSGVAEGHSISRKVKGVDTDLAVDWMDTHAGSTPPGPNPGTNPHDILGNLLLSPDNMFAQLEAPQHSEEHPGDQPEPDQNEPDTTQSQDVSISSVLNEKTSEEQGQNEVSQNTEEQMNEESTVADVQEEQEAEETTEESIEQSSEETSNTQKEQEQTDTEQEQTEESDS